TLGDVTETDFELRHSGALKQEELDSWSKAQMIRSRFARIRGTIRIQGTSAVKVGDLVDVDGLGERFKGAAFVAGIRHMLGQGDWETTLQIGMPPSWHVEQYPVNAMPAAGYGPAVAGLQVGVVTELQDDPDGEDRIRVRLPVVNADDEGVWARLASLDAGADRGFVFRPEIGDEVIVGFIADDPHEPVVLGMLHSSAKPSPISGSDENHEKGLVTRSGMRVVFNDDEPSLTIETPNGNKILISDGDGEIVVSDESGSSLTMSSDGIKLDSAKEISLKASTDITIEGLNVNIKAGSGLTAEGSATASFKSGGSTELKGSIVQIN
ncbi:MAG: type VI secretion system tip protein VgrG, partial [Rhodothermia bacterium]